METIIQSPDGFRQPPLPGKKKMMEIANESTTLAQQAAGIITQLLIERRTMDILVDDILAGKLGVAESIMAARATRLDV